MRAALSVVIPTLNAAPELAANLPALFEGLQAGLVRELVITDGGSTDDIAKVADGLGAELVVGPAVRGGQLARGVAASKGDWIMVLHADTRLPDGWSDAVLNHIAKQPDFALVFRLAFDSRHPMARVTAAWANARTRLGLPYGDQGLVVPRHLYDAVGGYQDIALMEDVALARALRGRIKRSSLSVETRSERYQAHGWLRQGSRNLWRLARYLCGADPATLSRGYQDR